MTGIPRCAKVVGFLFGFGFFVCGVAKEGCRCYPHHLWFQTENEITHSRVGVDDYLSWFSASTTLLLVDCLQWLAPSLPDVLPEFDNILAEELNAVWGA